MAKRRRRWLRRLAYLGVFAVIATAVLAGWFALTYRNAKTSTLGDVEFVNELRVPELDSGTREDGTTRFDLDVQTGETQFLADGPPTETWGVNGSFLGPTLRLRRGDTVEMNVGNDLPEATTIHWHGMHLPAAMDGGPHQMIASGETWAPTWTVDQPATTLWYHPPPHGETAEHIHRGVSGMILVDDPESDVELPDEYGVDDVPLIVQDRSFDGDNQFTMESNFSSSVGALGDEILVNGTIAPFFEVTTERVRLRLLNASQARFYRFGFDDDRSFQVIGTDGGLLEAPVELDRVLLSPGERVEIVVEFAPGETPVLQSYGGVEHGSFPSRRLNGHEDSFDVVEFRAADELDDSPAVPATLADVDRLDPADAATTRQFRLSGTRINREDMDMERIDEIVTVDTTEIWEVHNADGQAHNFHVHDVQFQVLDVNGEPPPVQWSGWKDTIAVPPGDRLRLIMHFADYTDADSPYMLHCHILRHEDRGMMAQFVVVEPGAEVDERIEVPGHHNGH